MIVALVKFELIVDTGVFTAGNIALFVQNFLICIEMFFLALAHRYVEKGASRRLTYARHVFDYGQFVHGAEIPQTTERDTEIDMEDVITRREPSPKKSIAAKFINNAVLKNLQDVANVSDVIGDARDVFKSPPPNHKYTKES